MAKGVVVSVRLQEAELAVLDGMGEASRADAVKALIRRRGGIGGAVRPSGAPSDRQAAFRAATDGVQIGPSRAAPGSMLKRVKGAKV